MVPVALAVISFSVNNRGGIVVDLWPAPFVLEAPLFAVVLTSIVIGILVGSFIAWMSAGRARSRARANARRAAAAEREAETLRRQVSDGETSSQEAEQKGLPARVEAA
jgi:hypothetical protein